MVISLSYLFIYLFIFYSFIYFFIFLSIYLFIYSFIYYLFIIYLFIYSFIYLFIHSFIHLFIYSYNLFIYTRRGPLNMAIPSDSPTAKDWCPRCQVSVVVKLRVFRLCLWCHSPTDRGTVIVAEPSQFGLLCSHVSLPWSIAERMQASHTISHILGERCLVFRPGKSFLNFPQHGACVGQLRGYGLLLLTLCQGEGSRSVHCRSRHLGRAKMTRVEVKRPSSSIGIC